mmetsp:Transcript_33112/g.60716  ORF Transcript_33112/g.60716 Transcript_33112/m.60716 type:complete len:88 (-) Transcript_33112:48-311(-)
MGPMGRWLSRELFDPPPPFPPPPPSAAPFVEEVRQVAHCGPRLTPLALELHAVPARLKWTVVAALPRHPRIASDSPSRVVDDGQAVP